MIEYKIIDLEIDANEIAMTGIDLEGRRKLNTKIEDKLNEMAKDGWDLHPGIIMIPVLLFYREKKTRRKK